MAGLEGFNLPQSLKAGTTAAGSPPVAEAPNGQTVTDYSTQTEIGHTNELAEKLQAQGNAYQFGSLNSGIDLVNQNGQVIATAAGSNVSIGAIGAVPTNETPASALMQNYDDQTMSYKVTLIAEPTGDVIVFDVMPEIVENHSANYASPNIIQHPGQILKYEGTSARDWTVTTRLIARTVQEATENLKKINIIRSWMMPFYGQGTADASTTAPYLGAPPPILTLKAYGKSVIGPVKCVLTSYNWSWPNDIDYIQTDASNGPPVPVPVVLNISLQLKEAWSPAEFSKFSLISYQAGDLPAAFGGSPSYQQSSQTGRSASSGLNAASIDTSQATRATNSALQSANASANSIANPASALNTAGKELTSQGSKAVSSYVKQQGGG